jgi:type IV fimbrial biogenesis protein FimT
MLTQRGFNLVELMITITVLGILLMVGLPAYTDWMQNLKVRSGTESVQNGLQLARTTAIARNSQVSFVFPTDNDLGYTVYSLISPSTFPADWRAPTAAEVKEVRRYNQGEDAVGTQVTVTPGGAYMVTFGALGNVMSSNPDGSPILTQIDVDSATRPSVSNPAIRPLRIVINAGGSTRTCDPSPNVPVGDPRHC